MSCPHCQTAIPVGSSFCPGCGRPAHAADVVTMLVDDATRLATPSRTPSSTPTTTDSGWLSSSGSIDHGRFGPGTVLDNRYRILGLLGRGGMGEVYRADDLRLGQQVALKFLPANLSRDPVRLAQFHNEVRTARQVSHPNVCRVYDIGEIDGQLFITMEYVDGEDLSILLRRIGRLPEDKGLEIARQVCAGLAAAHERGVLHRDFKPANIMLDGTGKVRVMDFSLAAVGEVADIRAGTPAYMAPEQLGGQAVTVRSDVYALGLVLYEIFTGRRAFDAKNLTELIQQHQSGTLTAPTTIVKTLDPAIEAAIVRCLDRDPTRRPASALRVSASLPGGDPLAAALAAGETPSPEMVAAAGDNAAAMTAVGGVMWLAVSAAAILATAGLAGRYSMLARVPLTKPAVVLADRAEEVRQSLGFTDAPADRSWGFVYDRAYLSWADKHGTGATRWTQLGTGRPAAVRFWYRTSPRALVPMNDAGNVLLSDPPVQIDGMTSVVLDTKGQLLRFEAAPPQVEPATGTPVTVDWQGLFAAAGLERAAFVETTPARTPSTYADERKAWKGTLPGTQDLVTIEAAGYRGRPMLFEIVAPWTPAPREPGTSPQSSGPSNPIVIALILVFATLAAWANLRRGRADKRGAFRLATFTFLLLIALSLVGPHVNDYAAEETRFFVRIGLGLFVGGALYLLYLGLEPFVRRAWPSMLVGWSRLLGGRIRDPLIGRDVLIGVGCGAALALLDVISQMIPAKLGLPEPVPQTPEFGALMGARGLIGTLLGSVNVGLQNAIITVFEFSGFRALFEWITGGLLVLAVKRWAWAGRLQMSEKTSERVFVALAVATISIISIVGNGSQNQRLLTAVYQAISTTLVLNVLLRIGIFASTIMFFANFVLLRMPLTLKSSALYAGEAWLVMAGIMALAATGFWLARRSFVPDPLS